MGSLYVSPHTTVLQYKEIPPRPDEHFSSGFYEYNWRRKYEQRGWYGYRASKAALNQLMRTLSIELARANPNACVATLHPGTVDTDLSKPFQGNVPADKLFTADDAAARLWRVLDGLTPADTGTLFAYDGSVIPY